MPNTYDVGERVKITVTFRGNGILLDPEEVRAMIKDPGGNITTISSKDVNSKITKVSTGIYSFEILLVSPGFWYYRVDDGGVNIADESYIQSSVSNLI